MEHVDNPSPHFNVLKWRALLFARFRHCLGGRWLHVPSKIVVSSTVVHIICGIVRNTRPLINLKNEIHRLKSFS